MFTGATALDVTTGCRPSRDAQSGTCTGPTGANGTKDTHTGRIRSVCAATTWA
jgi:hypothetical protein